MTNKNTDYDELLPCTVAEVTEGQHTWITIPDLEFSEIVKCLRCRLVQLPPSVTGEDLWPHGPYEIPNAHAKQVQGQVIYEPHIMRTVGHAYDAFRTAPGNRDGSYPTKRHFVSTLTAGGMDRNEAAQLYDRNQHSIVEFHNAQSPQVAQLPLA